MEKNSTCITIDSCKVQQQMPKSKRTSQKHFCAVSFPVLNGSLMWPFRSSIEQFTHKSAPGKQCYFSSMMSFWHPSHIHFSNTLDCISMGFSKYWSSHILPNKVHEAILRTFWPLIYVRVALTAYKLPSLFRNLAI